MDHGLLVFWWKRGELEDLNSIELWIWYFREWSLEELTSNCMRKCLKRSIFAGKISLHSIYLSTHLSRPPNNKKRHYHPDLQQKERKGMSPPRLERGSPTISARLCAIGHLWRRRNLDSRTVIGFHLAKLIGSGCVLVAQPD